MKTITGSGCVIGCEENASKLGRRWQVAPTFIGLIAKAILTIVVATTMADSGWAQVLTPTFGDWGINGNGPYTPGSAVGASFSIGGTRNNPQQNAFINVSLYLSESQSSISAPAVLLETVQAEIPGGSTFGPETPANFTLPTKFNGSPFVAGKYYIVFYAAGSTGAAVESSQINIVVPDISVQQPPGTNLSNNTSTVSVGPIVAGTNTNVQFAIANPGTANLSGLSVSITGPNASSFQVVSPPVSPVTPGGSTNFTLGFSPSAAGSYTATLSVASNVVGSQNPFLVSLAGTAVLAPTVSTGGATNVTDTGATVQGTVNANGVTTTPSVQYGLTQSYGSTVTASPSPLTGSSPTTVSADLSGLTPGTLYHYRVSATSDGNISNGSDSTFTTSVDTPALPQWAAAALGLGIGLTGLRRAAKLRWG